MPEHLITEIDGRAVCVLLPRMPDCLKPSMDEIDRVIVCCSDDDSAGHNPNRAEDMDAIAVALMVRDRGRRQTLRALGQEVKATGARETLTFFRVLLGARMPAQQ